MASQELWQVVGYPAFKNNVSEEISEPVPWMRKPGVRAGDTSGTVVTA